MALEELHELAYKLPECIHERKKKVFYNSWKNRIKKIPKNQKRVTVRDTKTSPNLQGWARRHLAKHLARHLPPWLVEEALTNCVNSEESEI